MYSLPVADLELIADRLESFWPKGQTFLITGGTGFFGRWLVESICFIENKLKSGNQFIIISRQNADVLHKKIPVLNEKIFKLMQSSVQDFKIDPGPIDYIIDAASDVSLIKSNTLDKNAFAQYVRGTQNILEMAKNKKIKKFLYVSSGGIYENSTRAHKEEDQNMIPSLVNETYADSKKAAESLVVDYSLQFRIPVSIARCFSFVGPYADEGMAVMQFIERKVKQEPIIVRSPDVIRSFMYPVDLVVGLFTILLKNSNKQIFNLGSDQPIKLKDVAVQLGAGETHVEILENSDAVGSLAGKTYYPDTSLIQKEFQFKMQISLSEALQKTVEFYKSRKTT